MVGGDNITEKRRREIAREFRRLLDRNVLRKNAIEEICRNNGISRRSLYSYCKRHSIPTN